jgi:PAS domain S-box-containing protein
MPERSPRRHFRSAAIGSQCRGWMRAGKSRHAAGILCGGSRARRGTNPPTAMLSVALVDPCRSAAPHFPQRWGSDGRFAVMVCDVAARPTAEPARVDGEHQFRMLVQGVADYAIYLLDAQGNITSWNLGGERIKGYRSEEIIGQHFSRFYTAEDRAKGEPAGGLAVAARDGRYEQEGWRVRKDGGLAAQEILEDRLEITPVREF